MKTEGHFTDEAPEKLRDGKRYGLLKEKWTEILSDSNDISVYKQI